jgi:hypothetical protein
MSAYSFHNYGCLFVKKIQNKVSACVYLTLELVQKAACNHEIFLEAGCLYTTEKTVWTKWKADAAFGTIFRSNKCLQRSKLKHPGRQKLPTKKKYRIFMF